MSDQDLDAILQMLRTHNWIAFAGIVAGAIVRLCKSDKAVWWFLPGHPIVVPPRTRPWVAMAAAMAYAVIQKLASGVSWKEAIFGGAIAGFMAISGHELVVESIRNGRDIGLPKTPTAPIVGLVLWMLVLPACGAKPVAEEGALLLVNAGSCRRRGLALVADAGTCAHRLALLEEFRRTDPACVGLYEDAGPVIQCRADGGAEGGMDDAR